MKCLLETRQTSCQIRSFSDMEVSGACILYPFPVTEINWGYRSEFHIRQESTYVTK